MTPTKKLYIHDVTLRDGSHAIRHQYSVAQVKADRQGARRGQGRLHRGRARRRPARLAASTTASARTPTVEWIEAVAERGQAREDRHPAAARHRHRRTTCAGAYDAGARIVRVATHCTEADVSRQHIEYARDLGMDAVGLPDDEPHDHAGGAGRAGQADGELRRDLRLRGRLRRRAEHERRARPLPRLQGRAEARDADRHARAPQPEPRRGQLDRRGGRGLRPRRRQPGRHGRRRRQRAARGVHRRGRAPGLAPRHATSTS